MRWPAISGIACRPTGTRASRASSCPRDRSTRTSTCSSRVTRSRPGRGYNPPNSTLADLKHLHATLGIDRVVFTQPSVYGTDNSAILNAMAALNAETPNRARAVVAITMDITDDELAALDAAGVRGVRLNTDNKGGMPIEMDEIPELAARIAPFGWHIEFLFPGKDIVELMPVFSCAHGADVDRAISPISRRPPGSRRPASRR